MVSVGIVGGSGYMGGEALRVLLRHPHANAASLHPPSHRSSHPHLPLVRAESPRETRAADQWRVGRTVPSIILAPA